MGKKKGKEYTGEIERIILSLPKNTVKLKADATVLIGDKLKKCEMKLDCDGITEARKDYLMLDPTDDAFAIYTFTPEFKEFLERGKADGKSFEEISDEWESLLD